MRSKAPFGVMSFQTTELCSLKPVILDKKITSIVGSRGHLLWMAVPSQICCWESTEVSQSSLACGALVNEMDMNLALLAE